MDNGAIQSQRSVSSISTSNQTLDSQSLLLWNQTRQHRVGNKKTGNPAEHVQEPRLSIRHWTYLFGCFYDQVTSANSLFCNTDFLVFVQV
ncbi:hypothetical protein MKW92_035221 [Papaver armeniacum]|nr:hypothetical protein MKW92_035221 [Papaver armeniacum]